MNAGPAYAKTAFPGWIALATLKGKISTTILSTALTRTPASYAATEANVNVDNVCANNILSEKLTVPSANVITLHVSAIKG